MLVEPINIESITWQYSFVYAMLDICSSSLLLA
jgi:hypothetical protein